MLGPNGSGKTTLIRMLLGLTRPLRATSSCSGVRCPSRAAAVLPHVGALVEGPGSTRSCPGGRTCGASRPPSRCCATRAIPAAVDAALERVGLGHAADRRFRGYSLGMKQRLGLAVGAAAAAPAGRPRRADERPGPRRHPRRPRHHRGAARGRRDGRRVVAPAHRGRGDLHARRRAAVGLADRRGRAARGCSTPTRPGSSSRPRTPTWPCATLRAAGIGAYRDDADEPAVVVPAGDAPEVIALLVRAGVAVQEARRRRPRLEELFARLTEGTP